MKVCSRCKRILPATKEYFRGDASKKDGLESMCKECRGAHFAMPQAGYVDDAPDGMKRCHSCGRVFPKTNVYFERKEHGKWKQDCLECRGGTFRLYLREPSEGMRVCRQCYEEYPETEEYFEKTSGHLRVVCRKCRGVPYRPPEPAVPDGYKRCSKCRKTKPDAEEYFSNHASRNICRECSGVRYMPQRKRDPDVPAGMRKCDKCGRVLPRTSEHFKRLKKTRWFAYTCRECNGDPPKGTATTGNGATRPSEEVYVHDGMIVCARCKRELPATLEYFYSQPEKKYGLKTICIECMGRNFRVGKDVVIRRDPDGMRTCMNCKELLPMTEEFFYTTTRTTANGVEYTQYSSYCKKCSCEKTTEWVRANRDRFHATQAEWREKNHERYLEYSRETWAKRWKGQHKNVTAEQWEQTLEYFNHACAYCGQKVEVLHRDHIVPVKMGGRYQIDNIVPACRSCNSSKGAKPLKEWFRSRPFYSEAREFQIMAYISQTR